MKKCTKCNEEKSFDNFCKQKRYKDGYQSQCRSCINEKTKQYYQENKEIKKEYFKQYREENKELINKKLKKYYQENKEYYKEYNKKNKERLNDYYKQYNKQRRQNDLLFKFKHNVRSLISYSFKRGTNKFSKNTKTETILGCTIEEFRTYIESKFKTGMSFDNQGKWHLDHIYPISLAKSEKEVIALNHYTNFQPLWAEENFKKSNKIVNNHFIYLYYQNKTK